MNEFKRNSFNAKDLMVSKKLINKSSWWTRLLNRIRGVESKAEYIWIVRITVDNPKRINVGDNFITFREVIYFVNAKVGDSIIATSIRPVEDHGIINPCVIVSRPIGEK